MNKEEILASSRAENAGIDEREKAALTEGNKIACIVGGFVCAALIIYNAFTGESQSFGTWAVYLSITGTTLFVKYLKLGKKHELVFGLCQLALALAFLITEFITKWPQN